ncbi:hypothetical protein JCM8547_008078 [Rhodosporidiobolus lusitaniae]
MLDRLPPELVDHVLAFIPPMIPPKWSRNTLLACCLVDKSISERAFALLWRDLGWPDGQNAKLLAVLEDERTAMRGTLVRSLRVYGKNPHPLVKRMPRLKELSLEVCPGGVDLGAVAKAVPELKTLRLRISGPLAIHPSLSFLALTCLTISGTNFPASFLTPAVLPSLRALAYCRSLKVHPRDCYSTLFPLDPGSLLHQLDMFQVPIREVVDGLPSPYLQLFVPTLVTVNLDGIENIEAHHLARHLRFELPAEALEAWLDVDIEGVREEWEDYDEYCAGGVRHLVHLVEQASLSSLHIPRIPPKLVSTSKTFGRLLETCEKKGVEVVYFDQMEEREGSFSWSFWRYAKQLKARQMVER